jgi:hypothetical protein
LKNLLVFKVNPAENIIGGNKKLKNSSWLNGYNSFEN